MDLFTAIAAGVIQGMVEWLPLSSEAVLSLFFTTVAGKGTSEAFGASVFVHTGTMVSALFYFREEYAGMLKEALSGDGIRGKLREAGSEPVLRFLIVSTVLTGLSGGLIYFSGLRAALESPKVFYLLMSAALALTGALRFYAGNSDRKEDSVTDSDSLLAGILQGTAIVPGISRSGSTSFILLYRGFEPDSAFRLSFLMSVPAVLAGSIGLEVFTGVSFRPMYLVSAATAALVGYLSIDLFLSVAERTGIAWICFFLSFLALVPVFI
ncbi:MAG: undecaprenyl-diphosphate phosphatase [Candidatus Nanohaloarchaea archaeon]